MARTAGTAGVDVVELGERYGRRLDPARGRPAVRRGQPDPHPARAQGQPVAIGCRCPRVELLVHRQIHPPTPPSGTDHWMGSFSAGSLGALSAAGSTAGETCGEADSGPIDASTLLRPVRRRRPVRSRSSGIGRTGRGSTRPPYRARARASRNRRSSSVRATACSSGIRSRLDSRGSTCAPPRWTAPPAPPGAVRGRGRPWTRSPASAASSGAGWLRPVTAKIFLEPALVASPDGSRIYGLGVEAPIGGRRWRVARRLRLRCELARPGRPLGTDRRPGLAGHQPGRTVRVCRRAGGRRRDREPGAVPGVDHGLRDEPTARSG